MAGRRGQQGDGLVTERGEKVLASSAVDDGGDPGATAVATTSALILLRGGEQAWRRRWHELDHGTWDGDDRVLRLRDVEGWSATLYLGDEAELALAVAVRDRVQASVVATRHAQVGDGPSVRVSVRQVQGGPEAGLLLLQEVSARGVRGGPELQVVVQRLRRELEEAVGLPRSQAGGSTSRRW